MDRGMMSITIILQEIKLLRKIEHPNIVKYFFGIWNKEGNIYLIMELLEGPDLLTHIFASNNGQTLNESHSAELITQILSTVEYLHSMGICHRDIKPENFLFSKNRLKMIDFGLSEEIAKDEMKERDLIGTPYYMAPEVIKGKFG